MNTELPNPYPDDALRRLPLEPGLDALRQDLRGEQPADPGRTGRRPRRWVAVAAAAAAVAAAVAVPSMLADGAEDPAGAPSGPSAPMATPDQQPSSPQPDPTEPPPATPIVPSMPWRGPTSYAVLDAPGWEVDSVSTDPGYGVSVGYRGPQGRFLSLDWTRERWYVGVRDSALAESSGSTTTEVLGRPADYLAYASAQQMAYLPVVDGYGLRVDTSFTTEAEFAGLVARLREVDAAGFAEALPAGVVGPDDAAGAASDLLADAAVPEGFDAPGVAGFNTPLSIAVELLGPLGCGWAEEYVAARSSGDAAAQGAAFDALAGSPEWTVLAVADDRRWFSGLVELMREDAPDQRITGSACPTEARASALVDE